MISYTKVSIRNQKTKQKNKKVFFLSYNASNNWDAFNKK